MVAQGYEAEPARLHGFGQEFIQGIWDVGDQCYRT